MATSNRSTRPTARGPKQRSRAERNIGWVEEYCRIPSGRADDVGKPVILREWQRECIRAIYDNPAGTRRAILTFGRKNGKTAISAFLLLLHLCGREAKTHSQMYSTAQSRQQAGLLFDLAKQCVRLSPKLHAVVRIKETEKALICPELGTYYRAMSAEAPTAFGLNPSLVIHDELGQVRGPRSSLYEALETATGAQDAPLSIIISTQAPTDADLLSVLIDDALAGHDKRVVVKLYTAGKDLDPFSEDAIRAANPAFGDFQNASEVLAMAEDARRMPSREAEYRNLILNQRVEANSPFVSASVWAMNGGEVDGLDGVPVYGGLDLSATKDLTALVLIGKIEGVWHVHPTFWLPGDNLADKARLDRVPYDLWHQQGHLDAAPGKSIEYEYVAEYLRGVFDRHDMQKIAFDRWAWKHLRAWLLKAGFDEGELETHFVEFGQGFQSMSPALRELESAMLEAKLAHGNHPVLTMCAANAVVQTDPAGNRKLNKARSAGRIDGMVALAMAMGAAAQAEEEEMDVRWMIG
jgi:phage terminase large subunit-like protein